MIQNKPLDKLHIVTVEMSVLVIAPDMTVISVLVLRRLEFLITLACFRTVMKIMFKEMPTYATPQIRGDIEQLQTGDTFWFDPLIFVRRHRLFPFYSLNTALAPSHLAILRLVSRVKGQ